MLQWFNLLPKAIANDSQEQVESQAWKLFTILDQEKLRVRSNATCLLKGHKVWTKLPTMDRIQGLMDKADVSKLRAQLEASKKKAVSILDDITLEETKIYGATRSSTKAASRRSNNP